jgi:WD40 repeat protein
MFSPDGKRLLAWSADGTVKMWDAETGQEKLTIKGHTGGFPGVAFSGNGRCIVLWGKDDTVKVLDMETGQEKLTFARGDTVVLSPDGKRIAASGQQPGEVKVWDADNVQGALSLKAQQGSLTSLAFSTDGKRLVAGHYQDMAGRVWDLELSQEKFTLKGHTNGVISVGFSADGKRLVAGSPAGTVRVWDPETGEEKPEVGQDKFALKEPRKVDTALVVLNPDGTRIAAWGGVSDRPGEVRVRDPETGRDKLTLRGHTKGVTSAAFSPDGKRLATGSWDGTVKVWEAP